MPNVILVNENDEMIGAAEKLAAHQQGLLHRAFSIFIFSNDEKPRLLLQQRADAKYHAGGLWTNTCCSHPAPGEDMEVALQNRLAFEMGVDADLHYVDKFIYKAEFDNGLTEHEVDHVYIGFMDRDQRIPFNKDEAQDYQWIDLEALEEWYADHPELFTPWFYEAYQIAKEG